MVREKCNDENYLNKENIKMNNIALAKAEMFL